MTLVELLVAFMVFLILIAALVSLVTRALETWTTGEARKDIYDRAEALLETMVADLRNAWSENEIYSNGQTDFPAALFVGDSDPSGRRRLRFVRALSPVPAGAPDPRVAQMQFADLAEIVYIMDHDARKNVLWRGARFFDRKPAGSILDPAKFDSPTDAPFTEHFSTLETGVLHVGFEYWTQYTTAWDGAPTARQAPETRWDSTRRLDPKFLFYKKRLERHNPDYVYPEIVRITLVLESTMANAGVVTLAEAADPGATTMRVNDTRHLEDPPGWIKIDAEWIEYSGRSSTTLTGCKRGRRQTPAQPHAELAEVHFGETFTAEVRLPAFREAQEP